MCLKLVALGFEPVLERTALVAVSGEKAMRGVSSSVVTKVYHNLRKKSTNIFSRSDNFYFKRK
jgi:hypothetical protein